MIEAILSDLRVRRSDELKSQIARRLDEMQADDNSHYALYNALGIGVEEGLLIDQYQNIGRFVYNHAGTYLEEAARACFRYARPGALPAWVHDKSGIKKYQIDCLDGTDAIEFKWRDATTDGDHVRKEALRLQAVVDNGLVPIRVMFYEPQREQARRIQKKLAERYLSLGGQYYSGEKAWKFVFEQTGVDLKSYALAR